MKGAKIDVRLFCGQVPKSWNDQQSYVYADDDSEDDSFDVEGQLLGRETDSDELLDFETLRDSALEEEELLGFDTDF